MLEGSDCRRHCAVYIGLIAQRDFTQLRHIDRIEHGHRL